MVSSAAALVVHDLKNQLGALEARLAGLAGLTPNPELQAAHHECQALRQRFVMYLALYGADGSLRAFPDDESPRATLELVARRQQRADSRCGLTVADDAGQPPCGHYDRRLVGMALEAAVHNAQRFARSRVELDAREDDGHLVFTVDDDGPGLGSGNDPGLSHNTGLGTALCRAVAQAHGTRHEDGGVRLFNRRPAGGARFELWLPL